jgi:hypothetical protein
METKQTAVEWLVNVVQSCIAPNYIPKEIIEQALQMEREHIEDAFYEGVEGGSGELYYKEKYGGQDE